MRQFFETNHYRNALPIELKTKGLATTGSDVSLLSALFALQREGCGGAIFNLTDEARHLIKTNGLAFFSNAKYGRGYPAEDRLRHYYTYQPWQETPLPSAWTSEGIWLGLNCMGLGRNMTQAIRSAAISSGSYYATKPEALLLVIPDLGLVVFTYYG